MKVSKSFTLQEFVDPKVFATYEKSSTWFIQPGLIQLAQFIRDYFGAAMTINNWHTGGPFKERGYRTPNSEVGGRLSQHRRGAAIDFNIKGIPPDEIRNRILADQKTFIAQGLTTLEDEDFAITWVHADMRMFLTPPTKILIVRPAQMLINSDEYNPRSDEFFYYEKGEMIQVIFPPFADDQEQSGN